MRTHKHRTDDNNAYEAWCDWPIISEISIYRNTTGVIWTECTAIASPFPNGQAHLPDGIHPDDALYAFKATLKIR